MLRYMDRSTIHYLKQKGWTNTQIGQFVGHHRDTIAKVLREPLDKEPAPRPRRARAAVFEAQITALYDLAQRVGRAVFLAALDLAAEQRIVGVEYLRALLAPPVPTAARSAPRRPLCPPRNRVPTLRKPRSNKREPMTVVAH